MNELATAYKPSELLQKLADDPGSAAVAGLLGSTMRSWGFLPEGRAEMDDDVERIGGCRRNPSDSAQATSILWPATPPKGSC